ncbi:MAG: DNA polymerase III subunit delta [Actinomycetota bacterium]
MAAVKPVWIIATADDFLAGLELDPLRAKARERGYAEQELPADDPMAIANALETGSLFDAGRLVIIRDGDAAKEPSLTVMARWAESPTPDTKLVVLTSTPTGTKRVVKALSQFAEVKTPDDVPPWEAHGWIVKRARALGRKMTAEAGKALVEALGTDLRELNGAVEQLVATTPDEETIGVNDVATQFRGIESRIHEFVDALFDRDRMQALRRLRALLSQDEPPILIVASIAAQLRILAMLSSGERRPASAVAKELGIREGAVKRAMRRSRNFSPAELRRAYRLVADADLAFKSEDDDPMVLELLVDEIAGPTRAART